jgi:hypothetical protein
MHDVITQKTTTRSSPLCKPKISEAFGKQNGQENIWTIAHCIHRQQQQQSIPGVTSSRTRGLRFCGVYPCHSRIMHTNILRLLPALLRALVAVVATTRTHGTHRHLSSGMVHDLQLCLLAVQHHRHGLAAKLFICNRILFNPLKTAW